VRAVKILWRRELIRFANDRMRIVTWLVQPLLFLFVLGSGLQMVLLLGPVMVAIAIWQFTRTE
jgi:ABC-2 type transport system permease protein